MTSCHRHPCLTWSIALAACMLLAACGKTLGGYPNHAAAPSLVAPDTSGRDNKTVYLDLIRQMQQNGAYYASLAHIDAYRQRYGSTPELRRLQADALRETGQWDAARGIYHELVSTNQAAAAWHGMGLIDAQTGNAAQADQALLKATTLEPVNAAYLSDLGYARLCAGQLGAAKDPLAMAAELDPANPKVIGNLALWAMLNGEPTRADAIMQRASLPPSSRDDVKRLALQLAARRPTASTTAKPAEAVGATPTADVPASMLQRFTSSATAYEARP